MFSEAITFINNQLSMKIIKIMLNCHINLNHNVDKRKGYQNYNYIHQRDCSYSRGNPYRVLNIVAQLD